MTNPMKSREIIQLLDRLGYNPKTDILVKSKEGRVAEFTMSEQLKDCSVFDLLQRLNYSDRFEITGIPILHQKINMILLIRPKV